MKNSSNHEENGMAAAGNYDEFSEEEIKKQFRCYGV